MAASWKRRSLVLLFAGGAAFGTWAALPGTVIDRAAFRAVVRGFANPPFFISGSGSRAEPWSLRTLSATPHVPPEAAPVVVDLGDDPGGVFQSSPPSPVDIAVILRNLRRLGADEVAVAAWLAWEQPDAISLAALELELEEFSAVLTAAPLSRGPVGEPLPPAFREASLPLAAVEGDVSQLPQVNRVPLPGLVLAGKAGFTVLEAEPGNGVPLLARWDDRVVLAFPLLALLERENLPLDGLEIRPGEFLRLAPAGPVVPIDASGRLTARLPDMPPRTPIAAEDLIDLDGERFAGELPVVRDLQSAADPATRRFSTSVSAVVAAIASDAGLSDPGTFRRLPATWEAAVLGGVTLLSAAVSGLSRFRRTVLLGSLAGVCLAAQWIGAGVAGVWLPGIPALVAVGLAAVTVGGWRRPGASPPGKTELEPVHAPQPPPEPAPEPAPKPAKKTARKRAAKKKSPARKTARKKPSSPES